MLQTGKIPADRRVKNADVAAVSVPCSFLSEFNNKVFTDTRFRFNRIISDIDIMSYGLMLDAFSCLKVVDNMIVS
ncbi:hypothetical protein C5167_041691 [Papaver somniferum]|nr:hypothetical protein C5167_041691 [Papaver somniferum]